MLIDLHFEVKQLANKSRYNHKVITINYAEFKILYDQVNGMVFLTFEGIEKNKI
jgi:hypothetical protein